MPKNKLEKLDFEEIIEEDKNLEWIGNKSFRRNIVNKINEIIEYLNKKD